MKCLHSPRATIRSSRRLSPEVLDDASKDRVFQMLHGENDLFWHGRIKQIFADVGIATRRIEQEEAHPVWQAWLTRERFDLSPDTKTAIRQLRKVLRDGGIKVVRDEFNIIDRRGDRLRCVFLLDLGAPGVA
jgi:hypothetical protein